DRVSENIRREISMIILEDIEDDRVRNLTITRVDVTKDLSLAKIYFQAFDPSHNYDVEKLLHKYAKYIRGEVSKRIKIRIMPVLSFRVDKLEEEQKSVFELFDRIEKERQGNAPKSESGEINDES
ncbi:MAG: 30S ribosome-binding factor RbfA, partial [Candidatus Omnitrophica bacterium]|nr:30S ribosome-binding factor RbfA [Candidatus Omnitrophota bacterium]